MRMPSLLSGLRPNAARSGCGPPAHRVPGGAPLCDDARRRTIRRARVQRIDLPRLRELMAAGAQVVEVLPRENFAAWHLPGAINLPLISLDAGSTFVLDRGRPVVVYCHDGL
jgi:Rhodanese-like domain